MNESAGKALARAYLFRTFLPESLPDVYLRAGNYLLLMGEEPRELEHTDALGVPRSHIFSVEHTRAIYNLQVAKRLGVSLYYGDVVEYLHHILHKNHAFVVLNLDIEGSYLHGLDPGMGSVFLFAWRNPETVIATYSSIGRDSETLWEGVKSLATFLWLAPKETTSLWKTFSVRYAAAGFSEPGRMVLRDLFWIRSHLEHLACTSTLVGASESGKLRQFFTAEREIWSFINDRQLLPLFFDDLRVFVSKLSASEPWGEMPKIGLVPAAMRHVVYRAQPPWSQRCYFTKFAARRKSVPVAFWARHVLKMFETAPLLSIDREGVGKEIPSGTLQEDHPEIVWKDNDLYTQFHPRVVEPKNIMQVSESVRRTAEMILQQTAPTGTDGNGNRRRQPSSKKGAIVPQVLVRGGKLTEAGIAKVRLLASHGADTEAVLKRIPKAPALTVRALIAVSRRHNGGRHFMRAGSLTAYGREQIRLLVKQRHNVEEIATLVPASVPIRSIRAIVASAKR